MMLKIPIGGLLAISWLLYFWMYYFTWIDTENHGLRLLTQVLHLDQLVSPHKKDPDDDSDFIQFMHFHSLDTACIIVVYTLTLGIGLIAFSFISLFFNGLLHWKPSTLAYTLAVFCVVANLIVTIFEFVILFSYYQRRHLTTLRFVFDFIFPNKQIIFDKGSFTIQEKAMLYRIQRLTKLNKSDFKLAYGMLLTNDQLLDRISVANELLNRADAKAIIASNKKLEKEIRGTYRELMDEIAKGLIVVDKMNHNEAVVGASLKQQHQRSISDDYVKRFAVVNELHERKTQNRKGEK